MLVFRRSPFYGLCMVVGAFLIGIAGLYHPVLTGDGAAQLGTIAGTAAWRTIHWALAFGLPFLYAGLVGVALRHSETPAGNQARAGVMIAGFGFALWAVNILFMVGAGTALARAYQIADPGLTATRAVFLYDMVHPFGLAAERLATFTLGLALYLYGWTVSNGGGRGPRNRRLPVLRTGPRRRLVRRRRRADDCRDAPGVGRGQNVKPKAPSGFLEGA